MPLEQDKGVLTMTKMEREQRAREWASRIEAFRASGMTQRQWAGEQGLSEDRVSYWYRKLGRPPESLVEPTWVPLTATTPDVSSLRLRVGPVEIDVATGFDPQLLQAVIQTVASCG